MDLNEAYAAGERAVRGAFNATLTVRAMEAAEEGVGGQEGLLSHLWVAVGDGSGLPGPQGGLPTVPARDHEALLHCGPQPRWERAGWVTGANRT